MEIIKKFNAKEKVIIFFETSFTAGLYINEYIKGNEIFPLKEFIDDYKGTMLGNYEFKEFIKKLKIYNRRAKNKLDFIGIDLEYQINVTKKIKKYFTQINNKGVLEKIKTNEKNTKKISTLEENLYEKKREKLLIENFEKESERYKKQNFLIFMGAWHVTEDHKEKNFAKEIRKNNNKILTVEIKYKKSKRTIKENGKFKIVSVNDEVSINNYKKYGDFFVEKSKNKAIYILENCVETKMI